jgi:vacuolar-type H+-ATPase subunit E/Vma4
MMVREGKETLRSLIRQDAWRIEERASYRLDEIREEFRRKLYSQAGRRLLKTGSAASK